MNPGVEELLKVCSLAPRKTEIDYAFHFRLKERPCSGYLTGNSFAATQQLTWASFSSIKVNVSSEVNYSVYLQINLLYYPEFIFLIFPFPEVFCQLARKLSVIKNVSSVEICHQISSD